MLGTHTSAIAEVADLGNSEHHEKVSLPVIILKEVTLTFHMS